MVGPEAGVNPFGREYVVARDAVPARGRSWSGGGSVVRRPFGERFRRVEGEIVVDHDSFPARNLRPPAGEPSSVRDVAASGVEALGHPVIG